MEQQSTQPSLNLLERFNAWIQDSIMIKLMSIGFLIIILLIPASWIDDLIRERQLRAEETVQEVASKWSGSQTISGPVVVIPYKKKDIIDLGKKGVEIREYVDKAFFLPNDLKIKGEVSPSILHRGIFDVVVYNSALKIKSNFNTPDFHALNIKDEDVLWKDAYLTFGITDLRGITDSLTLKVGNTSLTAEPSSNLGITSSKKADNNEYATYTATENSNYSSSGIIAKLNVESKENFNGNISIDLSLKGSKRLDFVPAGKTTSVTLSGGWKDPSFDGEFLPTERKISDDGFSATWSVLHFNRPFAQQWVGSDQHLGGADFGVKLLIPVDQYQKSMRTSKYGVLIILLTFMALFLVEITQKIRVHPFQYILIGAALIIYYTLLLSFSEHFGYNTSYVIASLATVLLISLYSSTFFPVRKLVLLFSSVLLIFYTFIFVIILEQDYSLLIGSMGLFAIVGLLMYFSRNVKWYKEAGQ